MKPTRFFALGGMREIGKICLIVEHDQEIAIIDAGIKFSDNIETGVDGIIPNYTYLKENQHKITGLFITHGHEDHIGGIPYLVQMVNIERIYGSPFAIALIKSKLKDRKVIFKGEFISIKNDSVFKFKHLTVDFCEVQHSIPGSFSVRVKTPNGNIMDTGDYRIDYTPIGNLTDFAKLKQIGEEGLDILTADSTNSMRQGHSPTEQKILVDIEKLIKEAPGKIFFTTFASNINRIKAVIDIGRKHKKRICAFGRSMIRVIDIARKMKFIDVPDNVFVDKKLISKLSDSEILILSTGSQGEELAALSQVATGRQNWVKIKRGDIVIFSCSPIPGNVMKIEQLINQLYKINAEIKENVIDGLLHTSGHAYKDEQKKVFKLLKPKYFVPSHGAYRQAAVHGHTSFEEGVPRNNIFILDNGEVLELLNHKVTYSKEKIDYGPIYIDSKIATKQTSSVINNREKLGRHGFINVVATINKSNNQIVGRTKIISRGALFVKENLELIKSIQKIAHGAILYTINNNKKWTIKIIEDLLEKRIGTFFYKEKRRNPIVLISLLDFDSNNPSKLIYSQNKKEV